MVDRERISEIVERELQLLLPSVRRDSTAVERLLDPEFREIGQSGRLWSRSEMIELLARSEGQNELSNFEMDEEVVSELGPDLILLTYRLTIEAGQARRSSIWRCNDGQLQILFHHGTKVARDR